MNNTETTYEVGDAVYYTVAAIVRYGETVPATVTMVRRYQTGRTRYEVRDTDGQVYTTGPDRMERREG